MKLLPTLAALMTGLFCASAALADTLPKPKGQIILTISGKIKNTTDGSVAQLDRDMLEELGMKTIRTSTPWHDGKVAFEGVPFQALMHYVGAEGETVRTYALNDYETQIPLADSADENMIVALKLNGEYMGVRDKGPIFIIYPYDDQANYQNQTYYARSAWQVARMIVE